MFEMWIVLAANQYSAACNSLQEGGKRYNVTAMHVTYARRHFMCMASLKSKPKQRLQLFSLYM